MIDIDWFRQFVRIFRQQPLELFPLGNGDGLLFFDVYAKGSGSKGFGLCFAVLCKQPLLDQCRCIGVRNGAVDSSGVNSIQRAKLGELLFLLLRQKSAGKL